jgi:hypothetical protein
VLNSLQQTIEILPLELASRRCCFGILSCMGSDLHRKIQHFTWAQ